MNRFKNIIGLELISINIIDDNVELIFDEGKTIFFKGCINKSKNFTETAKHIVRYGSLRDSLGFLVMNELKMNNKDTELYQQLFLWFGDNNELICGVTDLKINI